MFPHEMFVSLSDEGGTEVVGGGRKLTEYQMRAHVVRESLMLCRAGKRFAFLPPRSSSTRAMRFSL